MDLLLLSKYFYQVKWLHLSFKILKQVSKHLLVLREKELFKDQSFQKQHCKENYFYYYGYFLMKSKNLWTFEVSLF